MDFPFLRRFIFKLFLYVIISALLALYLDARLQLSKYQEQKERLCTGLSTVTAGTPELYALCTVSPGSWFGLFGK
jgi:hypothetical protein